MMLNKRILSVFHADVDAKAVAHHGGAPVAQFFNEQVETGKS
jgi:hypothetical protein